MFSKIIGVGGYLPEKIVTNEDLEKIVATSDSWIQERTGIKRRHIAQENEATSDLALKAAVQALENSSVGVKDIDAIIVATSTPDLTFPSTATIVQHKLNMKHGFAFDIQAVCSGFVYGLSVADSLIIAKRAKRILLIGAEVFSKIINWQDRNTCVLFGDGAGAVILEASELNPIHSKNSGIWGTKLYSDGTYTDYLKTTDGTSTTGKSGCVTMNGQEVFKHAIRNLSSAAEEILAEFSLQKEDIDWLIPHQANIRIINSTSKKLDLTTDKVIITVEDHANTSAASIPLALYEGVKQRKVKQGDLCLLEAMGAGFTWGAAILRM